MSTAAVSGSSIYQELQAYFQQRSTDVSQLGQDLTSGNLADAQQDYATLQSLGQGGPFANGDVFAPNKQREQDFTAIGQALQNGNLSAAQQAFAQLESTFKNGGGSGSDSAASVASATSTSASTARRQALLRANRYTGSCKNFGRNGRPTLHNWDKTWLRGTPRTRSRTTTR